MVVETRDRAYVYVYAYANAYAYAYAYTYAFESACVYAGARECVRVCDEVRIGHE